MVIHTVRKIFDDGRHNAFTDVTRFRNHYYVAFRNAENHMSGDGRIFVIRSRDGVAWEKAAEVSNELDNRDPKFLTTPNKLCLFVPSTPTEKTKRALQERQTLLSTTADGIHWSRLEPCSEMGEVVWRPREFQGTYYAAVNRRFQDGDRQDSESRLKKSSDGMHWELVSTIHRGDIANETSITFESDGTLTALVRCEAEPKHPRLCKSRPPYQNWEKTILPVKFQGPFSYRIGKRLLVAGRWYQPSGYVNTTIFWLDGGTLVPQVILPSGGDTSYAGIVQVDGARHWLTYYSSHEYSLKPNSHTAAAAIYLVELDLP